MALLKPTDPAKPSGSTRKGEGKARETPAQATSVNLGCTPLIVGICLIVLLGKFLPPGENRSAATTARVPPLSKPALQASTPQPVRPLPPEPTAERVETRAASAPSSDRKRPQGSKSPSRIPVTNNLWDHSVWQVERYLKKNLHDADSFKALEWGRVVETQKGYKVRCKFGVKNLLGRYVVQSKTFLLNKSGHVYAVVD